MGAEARCGAVVNGAAHEVKALLETSEIILRGEVKLKVPFSSITKLSATDGRLRVQHASGRLELHLGPAAEKWADKIRNPPSRLSKLGVKAGMRVALLGVSDDSFRRELADSGAVVREGRAGTGNDIVFLEATKSRDLAKIASAMRAIDRAGAIWVLHPRGVAGLKDVDVFAAARDAGLTYTKVMRFSDALSAEKLVIPKSER